MAGPRSKVKTGCRTCKSRKVKCDETFPECTRCLRTGRVCGGYGIWGGGSSGNANHIIKNRTTKRSYPTASNVSPSTPQKSSKDAQQTFSVSIKAPPPLISSAISTAHDREIFDYYLRLASTKLPGSFSHDFWSHAVVPAAVSEPAVLHAVLALSCTHKQGVLAQPQSPLTTGIANTTNATGAGGGLETLALQHYVKAIGHLKPHFEAKDVTSVKVALVVCVVFMALDCFAGRWDGARRHLETGLRLLRETYAAAATDQTQSQLGSDGMGASLILLQSPRTPVDKWLIHVFASLQIQFGLFSPLSGPFLLSKDPEDEGREVFGSLLEAWHSLQRLLIRAMHLESISKTLSENHNTTVHTLTNHHQTNLKKDVNTWLLTMQTSSNHIITAECAASFETRKAYHVVMAYHSMVAIKSETCLRHHIMTTTTHHSSSTTKPESSFSSPTCTTLFHTLLTHLCDLWTLAAPPPQYHMAPPSQGLGHDTFDTLRSMMDFGWIPLLYFLATKCRVSRIRRHALGFLRRVFHREGVWDGRVIAAVAERVIQMEESGEWRRTSFDKFAGMEEGRGGGVQGCRVRETDFLPDHGREAGGQQGGETQDAFTTARKEDAITMDGTPTDLSIPPTLEELQLPHNQAATPPIENQLVDVEMVLSGEPVVQRITLFHTLRAKSSLQSCSSCEASSLGSFNLDLNFDINLDARGPSEDINHYDDDDKHLSDMMNYTTCANAPKSDVPQPPPPRAKRTQRVALAEYELRTGTWTDFF